MRDTFHRYTDDLTVVKYQVTSEMWSRDNNSSEEVPYHTKLRRAFSPPVWFFYELRTSIEACKIEQLYFRPSRSHKF